ncbi:hypothetical protein BpHYR1_053981 [Brachionus plicatilis]|uniref:Uncharacterized protein n=1 Tax=Brachionus plicatilis TaxID=10195 RepID=A0A3M7RW50_BRAPC|nr:hypothetical protein BpHYR1_053981 [Brachionus plicatilis]
MMIKTDKNKKSKLTREKLLKFAIFLQYCIYFEPKSALYFFTSLTNNERPQTCAGISLIQFKNRFVTVNQTAEFRITCIL